MELYTIPLTHETGTFTFGEIDSNTADGILFMKYNTGEITNDANGYTLYYADSCDMVKDTEVTYINGRLSTVYINCGGNKLPLYLNFDFSDGDPEELTKAIDECAGLCAENIMNELKNAETPLTACTFEYYYDGEEMSMDLQDENGNIYSMDDGYVNSVLNCVCIGAGVQYRGDDDKSYEVFETIINKVHKRLSEEIPERFEVTDDFEISEPEMYD